MTTARDVRSRKIDRAVQPSNSLPAAKNTKVQTVLPKGQGGRQRTVRPFHPPNSPGLLPLQRRLGREILRLRKERGLTVIQLANRCRIASRKLMCIEAGRKNVTLSTLVRLSRQLGVQIYDMFHRAA